MGTPVFVRLSDGSSPITTLPVSLASVPSHAVTNAGTFAVQAAQSGSWTATVSGTVAATQSGTWTVQPGNTPNTTPWLFSIHDGTNKAKVLGLTNSNPLTVAIVDGSGDQISSFGGGTQYAEGATAATITGTAILWEDTSDTLRAVSAVKPLPVGDAGGSLTVDNGGTFAVQAAQSGTWTIAGVSGTISLPTGASTAAKQPALGTAGTASADVITVQGIASMTPLLVTASIAAAQTLATVTTVGTITNVVHVDDNAGSLTVDNAGTFAVQATQAGTWTVQPGNTANTTAWLVTGTGGTFPVTDSGGSLTVDAPVGTPVFVRLSDGSSPIATLPVSLASVPSHAVTNAGTFAVQLTTGAVVADVLDLTSSNPLAVAIVDGSGTQITSFGGGTQYAEGTDISSTPTGTVIMHRNASGLAIAVDPTFRLPVEATNNGTFLVQAAQSGLWSVGNSILSSVAAVEDVAYGVGVGLKCVAVRKDTAVSLASGDSKYTAFISNARGANWVAIEDGAGGQITSFGGGTQYTEGDTDASITGTAILWEDTSDTLRAVSAAKPLPVSAVQSGTWNIATVTTVTAVTAITNALPAGTNAIGKLAANSGVDIGDVDVTSVPADPFGVNADAASATGSISAKLRFIASTGIPITGTVTVGSHAVTNAGTFAVQQTVAATGGTTPGKLISAASTNATSVKGSAGTLYTLAAFNNGAAARYFKLYNKASAPTVGTDTPVQVMMIPAGGGLVLAMPPQGIAFGTGIAFALTSGIADADTGAVAANEVCVSYSYN